jgi:plastocyanin
MSIQNDKCIPHDRMIIVTLWLAFVLLLLCVFTGITVGQVQYDRSAKASPMTWTVLVGGEAAMDPQEYGPAGAWQFMRFYPENITINVGDKIAWKLASTERHTVTFPAAGEEVPTLLILEGNGSQRMLFNPLVILPQVAQPITGAPWRVRAN